MFLKSWVLLGTVIVGVEVVVLPLSCLYITKHLRRVSTERQATTWVDHGNK